MINLLNTQLALEDLLADLHHARKRDQLGRLALLAYCEVKGWARQAGKPEVADLALRMFAENPCLSKAEFLQSIDNLIDLLELHEVEYQRINRRSGKTAALFYVSNDSQPSTFEQTTRDPAGFRVPQS